MVQKGREDLVSFAFWTTKEMRDDMKRAAIDLGRPVQDLMAEAVEQWLKQHAKRKKS